MRQRGGVNAVLLFQTVSQILVQTRSIRQSVVFIVMGLRIRQQVLRRVHQFIQLAAVNLRRHAALQTQHAAVQGHAGLVEADPCIGKLGDILA